MPASFEDLRRWYKEDTEATDAWREQAEDDFACVAGEGQWTDADQAVMREQMRPAVTFNRLDPIIDAVSGAEVSNRQEVHYLPVELGDVAVNEILTSGAEWVRDQCQAEDEESDAFRDLAICGMGWTETRLSYDDDPSGEISIDRLDPIEMRWDSIANKRNLRDARRVGRVREVDIDDARALFPDVEDSELDASWARDQGAPERVQVDYPRYEGAGAARNDGESREKVTLVEYQYFEREPVWEIRIDGFVLLPQTIEVDSDQRGVLLERLRALGESYRETRRTKKVYYRAILGADILSNERLDPQEGGFRYKCITGKRDRNTNTWYGLVKGGKDPQRWANKWLSQVLHIINTNAKGGLMAEADAFPNWNQAAEDWANPQKIVKLNSGALTNGKVQQRQQAQYPAGIAQLMEYAIVSIRECMGVNPELLGQVAREQAGVLEYQRRQAGMTILSNMFDALRLYRKMQGKLLLEMMMTHLADGRLIRVLGEDGEKYVPLLAPEGVTKFDVKVDEAPSSPNLKERAWQMFERFLPVMSRMEVPNEIWAEMVRYSPLPAAVSEKLAQLLLQPQQPDPMKMAELEQAKAELGKTQAEIGETEAAALQKRTAAMLNEAKVKETGQRVALDAMDQARDTLAAKRPPMMPQGVLQDG